MKGVVPKVRLNLIVAQLNKRQILQGPIYVQYIPNIVIGAY